jgi:2-polyprenyl-3-methyl-5-hydroxy-6-metoxy-1,4-benzoquinol methylase
MSGKRGVEFTPDKQFYQSYSTEEDKSRTNTHYEQPVAFFNAVTGGRWNVYSCNLWDDTDDQTASQEAKLDLMASLMNLQPGQRILDVGCGYGFFSKEALGAGFDVQAIELATNERKIAQEMTDLSPAATSFEEYQCEPESLGVVLMSQILEHALDVNLWVDKAHRFLQKDGILAIALPNYGSVVRKVLQERDPFVCPPTHLNFFNPRSLSMLLGKHGFKVEKVEWVSRLPKSSFEKRCPRFAKPLLPLVHFGTTCSLGLIDLGRLGMVIRVYGRKT